LLRFIATGMLFLALVARADADVIINGGFETGDFTGWSTLGVTSIQTAAFGAGPTMGTYDALLQSGDSFSVPGFANLDQLDNFLSLTPGALDNLVSGNRVESGSAIKQTFTVTAGEVLSFSFDFLTNESTGSSADPTFNDFAFVSLNSTPTKLADTFSSFTTSATMYPVETGFQTFSVTIQQSGSLTLGLGVVNVGDTFNDSGLLVDNAMLTIASPEPSTQIMVTGLGAVMALVYVARKAREFVRHPENRVDQEGV
jgi:hypothetical protein